MEKNWENIDKEGSESFFCPGSIDERPPTNTNHIRLYSNPLCPYAEKARLALAARGIEFQLANIDLNDKPRYFDEDGGTVPVLEKTDGTRIADSANVIEYAIKEGSGIDLLPSGDIEKEKEYIKQFDNGHLVMEMISALFQGGVDHVNKLISYLEKMEEELGKNDSSNKFFNNSSEITLADIHLSPILTRVVYAISDKIPSLENISLEKFPKIATYVLDISSHPKIGEYVVPEHGWINYVLCRLNNSGLKLPYPIDLTNSEDSQSQKNLYVLNGSTGKPRTNQNFIRLYGHPLCPFVERALLTFKAKEVEYQFCGVDLTTKNKWHMDINGGLVPFIELPDGKFIIESFGVSNWVQEFSSQGVNLYPGNLMNKDAIKESVETYFKIAINIILAIYKKEERDSDGDKKYVQGLEDLNEELEKSDTEFFLHQEHETMADLMTFPFVHRAFLIKSTDLKDNYYGKIDFEKIKKLKSWYDILYEKYKDVTAEEIDFKEHLHKNLEADGPKVQLYYPIPSEKS